MNEEFFAYCLPIDYPITCTMAGVRVMPKLFQHNRRALPDFASFLMVKGSFVVKDELGSVFNDDVIREGEIHTIAPGVFQQNPLPLKPGHTFLWFHFKQDIPVKIVSRIDALKIFQEQVSRNSPQKFILIPRHFKLNEILLDMKSLHQSLIKNIHRWGVQDYGSHLITNQLLYLQHTLLLQQLLPDHNFESRRRIQVRKAQDYIRDFFKKIQTVDDVAKHLNLNAAYLSRCFREYSGSTLIGFIQSTKINAAKQMIEQGETNIKKVAFEVGYTDLNYFCRIFRKITGKTTKTIRISR